MNNPTRRYLLTALRLNRANTYDVSETLVLYAHYPGDVLTRTHYYTPDWSITESGPTTIATSADKTLRYTVCED